MTKAEFLKYAKVQGYAKTGESEYAPGMNNDRHTHDFAFAALVAEGVPEGWSINLTAPSRPALFETAQP